MSRHISGKLFGVALVVILVLAGWLFTPQARAQHNAGLQRAIEAQEKHTPALMGKTGVVGTAASLNHDGGPVVKVYVEKAANFAGLPRQLDGVIVVPEVTGKIRAFGDTTARYRPTPIGVSTGHPAITAGTIGARVTDGTNVYALSNNHVYADENRASLGDNALQPGAYDGGTDPGDAIGTLYDFEPISFGGSSNVMDAAIVITSASLLNSATLPDGYGVPSSETATATPRLRVKKYGRTTSLTSGRVDAVNATVDVGYDTGVARFVGQIVIKPGPFSAGGDSGSLIVTEKGNHPVGLLFAGSTLVTIANPIDAVLNRFNVWIDDGVVTGSIIGTVTDSTTGTALEGAAVSVDTGQSANTDSNGHYTLAGVPVGDRTVTVSATGYVTQQSPAVVTENNDTVVDFALDVESSSGGTGAIKGKVTDAQTGAKLAGVLVETDTGQSATSNPGARYSISDVPEGNRTVTASKAGYVTASQEVSLAAGDTATADFALQPE